MRIRNHFKLTVRGNDYSVSVNNRTLIPTTRLDDGYVNGLAVINISTGAPADTITFSNFVLTPL